jgi:O-antigen biosynthesis protein
VASPLVSVIIVNYKVPQSLRQALHSLQESAGYGDVEVIVVDNASNDGSEAMVKKEFPEIKWLQLKQNIGFGKACNVGAKNAEGEYLLLLNPDTIVTHTTISSAVDFMRQHPDVGLLGPKLLNPDGTLQRGCRRGFPTPAAAFYHFSGLSRLFPESKRFGHYNLTWLDPDLSCPVDAISGCFMVIPRKLFFELGGFDEEFFMYGEDLDLCWRVHEKGLLVWYHPEIRVIHLKGRSSARRVIQSRIAFYEAMIIYSRKYERLHGAFFPGWLIFIGIALQAAVNIGARLVRSFTACLIDLGIINFALWACLRIRFMVQNTDLYEPSRLFTMAGIHVLLSVAFVFMFAYNGIYSPKKYGAAKVLLSGFFASILFMACVYFIKSIAFSRLAFAGATVAIMLLLYSWRAVGPIVIHGLRRTIYSREKVIIIGSGPVPRLVIQNMEKQRSATIAGVVWTGDDALAQPGQFEGYPVLGAIGDIAAVLERVKVDVLLIATAQPWYSNIIEALAKIKAKNLSIRWVPRELFDKKPEELPAIIPFNDFSV